MSKIIEKVVHHQTDMYLENNNIFYKYQFGFRANHYTNYTLTEISDQIRNACDKGLYSCGVYLDLQKAFDKVNQNILLANSCKTQNHPQTIKPPTNYLQASQTTYKPAKYQTNQPKIASFLPWRHFLWLGINSGPKNPNICHPTKYDPFTYPVWEQNCAWIFIFLPDFAFCLLHCTVLYNP